MRRVTINLAPYSYFNAVSTSPAIVMFSSVPAPCVLVRPPRVKASPCALECRWLQTVRLRDVDGAEVDAHVAFGQVVGVHIDDRFIRDGLVDTAAMHPIARGGYQDYFVATSDTRFSLRRPTAGGG
jgi:flavin reductase (DIM6/NTAB) family NADH-FMN oxidoreductase RutF